MEKKLIVKHNLRKKKKRNGLVVENTLKKIFIGVPRSEGKIDA